MIHVVAQADPVLLVNPIKPVLFAAVAVGWAWLATQADKDAGYFYLGQRLWAAIHAAGAAVGLGLMLLIPIFWIGLPLGAAVAAGPLVGYAFYRNPKVPAKAQWHLSKDMFTKRYAEYQRAQAQNKASYRLLTEDEEFLQVPTGEEPFVDAHEQLEALLEFAVPRGADRIDVQANKNQVAAAVRIDGVRYDRSSDLDPQQALEIVDYLKEAAGLDVEDRRKQQHAVLGIDRSAGQKNQKKVRHWLDLTTAGSTRGVQLTLEIDRSELANLEFSDLGLLDAQRKQLEQVLAGQGGVVLTAAPPKQGVTTLTYALMQRHDPYTSSVMTLEDEVQFEAEGVKHYQLDAGYTEQHFHKRLSSLLRTEPDVMMLSHLPNGEVGELVCKNAEEVRFYIPLVESDTFAALRQWVQTIGNKRLAGESLTAIVAARLVRRLCKHCRTPYKPDRAALKRLNINSDDVSRLYHASGEIELENKDQTETCPQCLGMGYRGRVGVYEVMPIDTQARTFIAAGEMDRLRSHLRKQKVLWLQEAALQKVVDGETDITELTRVMGGKKKSSSSQSQSQPAGQQAAENKAE